MLSRISSWIAFHHTKCRANVEDMYVFGTIVIIMIYIDAYKHTYHVLHPSKAALWTSKTAISPLRHFTSVPEGVHYRR